MFKNGIKKIILLLLTLLIFITTTLTTTVTALAAVSASTNIVDRTDSTSRYEIVSDILLASIRQHAEKVDIRAYDLFLNEVQDIFGDLLCDYPEFYYMDNSFSYQTIKSTGTIAMVYFDYVYSDEEIKVHNEEIESAINEIVTPLIDKSNTEKIRAVYDYMLDNYTYVANGYRHNNIYSLLVEKEGACLAFSQAFKEIMDRLQIPCELVLGYTSNHAWNKIYIYDDWYIIDMTRDLSTENSEDRNFVMSELYASLIGVPVFKDEYSKTY